MGSSLESGTSEVRRMAKRETACGLIITALCYTQLRGVMKTDDKPAQMLTSDSRYSSNRMVSRVAIQTQLVWMPHAVQCGAKATCLCIERTLLRDFRVTLKSLVWLTLRGQAGG